LIDATGTVTQCNNRQELGLPWHLGAVPLDTCASFYSQCGEWLLPTCFCGLLLVLFLPIANTLLRQFIQRRIIAQSPEATTLPTSRPTLRRGAFSLLELLAVATILGTVTLLVIPRITVSSDTAKSAVDRTNRAQINAAVERWHFDKGTWQALNLTDIGADTTYFPDGIANNPITGNPYALSAATHRVIVSGGGGGGGK